MSVNATGSGWLLLFGFALAALGLAQDPPPPSTPPTPALSIGGYGMANSNGSMIAVTGPDRTGSAVLYVLDTENRQLAVYQASGGGPSTMEIKFIAGRKIDLDLQVLGYNDKSEHSYRELLEQFEKAESR